MLKRKGSGHCRFHGSHAFPVVVPLQENDISGRSCSSTLSDDSFVRGMPFADKDLKKSFRSSFHKIVDGQMSMAELKTATSRSSVEETMQMSFSPQHSATGPVTVLGDEAQVLSGAGCRMSSSSTEGKSKLDVYSTSASKELSKLAKRESLKVQKKHYRHEKKRAAKELLSTLKDTSVIILADWLKVRGLLKSWIKYWCVLKPGLVILYKSPKAKSSHWVATVLLNSCEVLERPSKKDGFCFKIFHPLEQSIWSTKGPKGENIGAITQPLPFSYLIFRAPSEAAGKCWMDALELALHCSSLLMRTMTRDWRDANSDSPSASQNGALRTSTLRHQLNESDCEKHFNLCGLDEDTKTDKECKDDDKSESESDEEDETEVGRVVQDDVPPVETPYVENLTEELGQLGHACQTEEVAEENKSIIWTLIKQLRPGMDLSRVVLPTFILEPRSFLDKLADYYYHADLLSDAVSEEDPFTRMKMVVRWYLSGFYKKPKGLKKPYNPILGETFRCFWRHPKTGSRTFYVAEQISHHPPISAFYISNRQDGFAVIGSILAKSKFFGNSLSAIMDGTARVIFLKRGEDYVLSMPYAHCRGILVGTLTMEMGGTIRISCEKTGYHTDLEFKLKPFLGSGEASNRITGKIKLGDQTLATLDGRWDHEIFIKNKTSGICELFWSPTPEVKSSRLHRWTVPVEAQMDFESDRLWQHVSRAIVKGDQVAATAEKFLLEDAQRKAARERKVKMEEWTPRFFEQNLVTGDWVYKFADLRPWDPMNDVVQYENEFVVRTKTHHQMPIVHTTSISNIDEKTTAVRCHSRHSSLDCNRLTRLKRLTTKPMRSVNLGSSGKAYATDGEIQACDSESSLSPAETVTGSNSAKHTTGLRISLSSLQNALDPIIKVQQESVERITALQGQLIALQRQIQLSRAANVNSHLFGNRDVFVVSLALLIQLLLFIWFK